MAISVIKDHGQSSKSNKLSKNTNDDLSATKKAQLASLEQGLKEAILISKGEMKGTPVSELWND